MLDFRKRRSDGRRDVTAGGLWFGFSSEAAETLNETRPIGRREHETVNREVDSDFHGRVAHEYVEVVEFLFGAAAVEPVDANDGPVVERVREASIDLVHLVNPVEDEDGPSGLPGERFGVVPVLIEEFTRGVER